VSAVSREGLGVTEAEFNRCMDPRSVLSFVELSPSLYAGMVRANSGWQLAPELAALSWAGRGVLLAPPSTITTNARETWGEFFLARLLRKEGADVKSIRLPPLNGRRRTLAMADQSGWEVVEPPVEPWQAGLAADKAKEEARRLDAYRRALPRDKPSPKLEKALAFVQKHQVTRLTKDVVKKAKKKGISRATLKRAIDFSKTWKAPPPPPSVNVSVYLSLLAGTHPSCSRRLSHKPADRSLGGRSGRGPTPIPGSGRERVGRKKIHGGKPGRGRPLPACPAGEAVRQAQGRAREGAGGPARSLPRG
jgi:hypothetical protein